MSRIVVTGNPVDGFTFYALPEDWEADDISGAIMTDWWIADLHPMSELTGDTPIRTLTEDEDRALFPADWSASYVIDTTPTLGEAIDGFTEDARPEWAVDEDGKPMGYDVEAQVYAEDARKWAHMNRDAWLTLARQEDQINDKRKGAGQ